MSPGSPSERLRAKLDLAYPALRVHAEQIWSSPAVRELYPAYLRTMHAVVRAAVPLMTAALARARALADVDRVAAGLAEYLAHHVDEERGHDAWLLADLEATGADPDEPLRRMPSARVATLVGAQYYWLEHHHPVSLLGHIAAIEGHPPPVGFARRLQELTGYPSEAFRAIARHERLDIRHRRELYEAIDRLPLSRADERVVGVSALHTVQAIADVLDEIRLEPAQPAPADTHQGGRVG